MRLIIRRGGAATACRSRRLQPATQCGLERRTAGARSVPFGLAIFLRLIVMPLDRIIHAYAEHYDLGRERREETNLPKKHQTFRAFPFCCLELAILKDSTHSKCLGDQACTLGAAQPPP